MYYGIVSAKCGLSRFFKLPLQTRICRSRLFMKTKPIFQVLLGCVLVLFGCKDNKPQYGAPMNLRILGVTGKSDLTPGLKLGLFVSEPVGADNIPMTVSDYGMPEPDNDIRWAFDQSQSSRFFVYAPYDESFTGKETVTINTPTDQRSKDWLLQGNLMTCVASGGPKETSVTMKLKHAMTAMTVSFDNRTGYKIDALSVTGFMTEGELDLITGTLTATGSTKPILPMRSPYDNNTFTFIYIPQNTTPLFTVTLSSGKTIGITFDNYCHEYPGSIIRMNIQLDESTPKANILELSGVNISQWTTNGVPSFVQVPEYICLDGLKDVQPKEDDGFFSAYINKVTVTAVDRTSDNVLGVILEDSTCAVRVWAYDDSPLIEGNTIVGPVLGIMNKPSEDEFYISHFYTYYATVAKTVALPCTEGTFDELERNIDQWENRRMRFSDVTLVSDFENGRAVFLQDTTSVSVICPNVEVLLAEGASGDLIGFPVRTGSDIMIMVYDAKAFNDFCKEPVENVLTKDSIYGLYRMTAPDTAVYVLNGPDMDLQYSLRFYDYGRTMQVTDTRNGEAHIFLIYDMEYPVTGHEYRVAFNAMGASEEKGMTMKMECLKVTEDTAWFLDRSGRYGLILPL